MDAEEWTVRILRISRLMLPFRWPLQILDHIIHELVQELSQLPWSECFQQSLKQPKGLIPCLLCLAFVQFWALRFARHVKEKLIEDLMLDLVLLNYPDEVIVLAFDIVRFEKLLEKTHETLEDLINVLLTIFFATIMTL